MECSRRQEQIFYEQRGRSGMKGQAAPVQCHHAPCGEREVRVGTLLPVADEGMAAVDHGGDEDAVGARTGFTRRRVGKEIASEVMKSVLMG